MKKRWMCAFFVLGWAPACQASADIGLRPSISPVTPSVVENLPMAEQLPEWRSEIAYTSELRLAAHRLMSERYIPWPAGMESLSPGSRGNAVRDLRQALAERGWQAEEGVESEETVFEYGPLLTSMVRQAQLAHGLEPDGIAGELLYQNLALPPAEKAARLLAWADEIETLADATWAQGYRRMIVANVPSFYLRAIDLRTGQTEVESRIIVGLPHRATPIFQTNVTNLKFNPDWSPPPSLRARGKVYTPAGPNNPLGRMRFSTDNNQHIYLHDTNEPGLYNRNNRALSSGCIRVEQWLSLSAFLADQGEDDIMALVDTGRTTFEQVEETPVHIVYSTVDVIAGGSGVFPDVYQRER